MFQIVPWVKAVGSYNATGFPERRRSQTVHQDGVRRPVSLADAVRDEPIRRAFGLDLLVRFAERKRLRLRKDVGQQQIVVASQRVERVSEGDEVARNESRALVDQLVERRLAVGTRLARVDGPCLMPGWRS